MLYPSIRSVAATLAAAGVAVIIQMAPAIAGDDDLNTEDYIEDVLKPSGRVLYTETNDISNAILAFRRDDQGRLTPLPGSPFPAGGKGVIDPSFKLGPPDADQQVVVDRNRRLLFAVNSGSNTIAVFHIRSDGSLRPVPGSPFPSGGINPVSVGLRDNQIVIINKNEDPAQTVPNSTPTIVTRHVTASGKIIQLPGDTTINLVQGTSPSQALAKNIRPFVFDALIFNPECNRVPPLSSPPCTPGSLASYKLFPSGQLVANPPQLLPASEAVNGIPPIPLGLWANPAARQLYVGFTSVEKLGVYTWDANGVPIFERTVPNSGLAICWLRTNSSETRLYTTNSGSGNISVYDTTDPSNPKEIQVAPTSGAGGPYQLEVDPTDRFLYVVTERGQHAAAGNAVHVFAINPKDGTLTEVPSSPVAVDLQSPDAFIQGVALY
ncbi:MAG: beta-propeller fold lactonase family protein [Acetobacteraceae bacterium]|nr:beta-propeller fold lactonase family protein [Acetobacteraceae bacterium]